MVHYLELKADILFEMNEIDDCLALFEKIIQLTNSSPYYLSKLAYITTVKLGLDEAIRILDRGIEEQHCYALHYHKAILYFAFSNEQEAYHQFTIGLDKDFDAHEVVFQKIPELREDPRIQLLLAHYEK